MLPLGDAKGTALALMVELLAAGLTGANYAADASSFLDDKGGPPGTGQLIIALDPAAFGGADAAARFGALAVMIEAQAGARLPGRRRLALRGKARREGLPSPTRCCGRSRSSERRRHSPATQVRSTRTSSGMNATRSAR